MHCLPKKLLIHNTHLGFEQQAKLVADTMQEIKSSKYNSKFTKNWHQTGWTLGATERFQSEDEFLSQILSNLSNDSIEMQGFASLGIKDITALTPVKAIQMKPKPGRKPKDTGKSKRSQRTYSVAEANNIASFVWIYTVLFCLCSSVLFAKRCFVCDVLLCLCFVLLCV